VGQTSRVGKTFERKCSENLLIWHVGAHCAVGQADGPRPLTTVGYGGALSLYSVGEPMAERTALAMLGEAG